MANEKQTLGQLRTNFFRAMEAQLQHGDSKGLLGFENSQDTPKILNDYIEGVKAQYPNIDENKIIATIRSAAKELAGKRRKEKLSPNVLDKKTGQQIIKDKFGKGR